MKKPARSTSGRTAARRIAALAYGISVYVVFLGVYLYSIVFISGVGGVPITIDKAGHDTTAGMAILINTALLSIFALQHSIMARRGFKAWWTKFVPVQVERSTYVLASNIALAVLILQWRALPGVIWHVEGIGATILTGICFAGFGIVLISSFLLDHFELFGLRQVFSYARGKTLEPPKFRAPLFYKAVRHPIYRGACPSIRLDSTGYGCGQLPSVSCSNFFWDTAASTPLAGRSLTRSRSDGEYSDRLLGFTIAFWATPHMSVGHLVFAIAMTAFTFIAIPLEERDLVHVLGTNYEDYKKRVPMIVPGLPKNRASDA